MLKFALRLERSAGAQIHAPLDTGGRVCKFRTRMKILDVPQSGSVGNQTSSRNRSGQYRRARSMPTQPRTAAQVNARARLTSASAAWRGLTDAQRAAWASFAQSFSVVNSLGSTINLTGSQCFVKVNTVLALTGSAQVTIPPALPSFGPTLATALTATAGTQALSIASTLATGTVTYMVFASPQLSAGVSYCGQFRYLQNFTIATTNKLDILAAYTAKFGAILAGKKIFVKVVQNAAGMQDNGTLLAAIVGA